MTRTALTTLAIFCTLLLAGVMVAGPLTPPAGPVTDTGRFGTLIELNQSNTPGNAEALFVITQPGSYVLTANANAGNRSDIHVGASNVTIDLNGYTLEGTRGAGSQGITPAPSTTPIEPFTNITVRNGSVKGFNQGVASINITSGVGNFNITEFNGVRLADLHVSDVALGVAIRGGGVVTTSIIEAESTGIAAEACAISDCSVRAFDGPSPVAIDGVNLTIERTTTSMTSDGTGSGAIGFDVRNSTLRGCIAIGNGVGYDLNGDSVANSCVASTSGLGAVFEFTVIVVDCNF